MFLQYILILSSQLLLRLQTGLAPSGYSIKRPVNFSSLQNTAVEKYGPYEGHKASEKFSLIKS
jgi:hypothetical protein